MVKIVEYEKNNICIEVKQMHSHDEVGHKKEI